MQPLMNTHLLEKLGRYYKLCFLRLCCDRHCHVCTGIMCVCVICDQRSFSGRAIFIGTASASGYVENVEIPKPASHLLTLIGNRRLLRGYTHL
jgi:hypothetical protein